MPVLEVDDKTKFLQESPLIDITNFRWLVDYLPASEYIP